MNMKKIIFAGICVVVLTQCKPYEIPFVKFASVAVTHTSPGTGSVDILVDGLVTSIARIGYNVTTRTNGAGNSVYLPVKVGSRTIMFSADTAKTNFFLTTGDYTEGKIHSIYAYDTLLNGKVRFMKLNDNLTLPTGTNAKVRFLNLAPLLVPVDVTFLRTSATPLDSVTISNIAYAGATPNTTALEQFVSLPGGTYTIKLKNAGTQTVVISATTSTMLTAARITTVFASGTVKSLPLAINTINNFGSL